MKKMISVLLTVSMLLSFLIFCAGAQAYPESAHDYANDCRDVQTYTHPGAPDAVFVTFSEKTCFDPGTLQHTLPDEYTPEDLEAFVRTGTYGRTGDWIEVYDKDDNCIGAFTGDDLAGQTLYISGDTVTIVLVSDARETAYGYAIDRITDEVPDGFALVKYHLKDECIADVFRAGETVELTETYAMRQVGKEMIVGWKTAQGNVYSYDNVTNPYIVGCTTDLVVESKQVCDLYPVTCPISLTRDDVFRFQNRTSVFNADLDGYLFKREHFRQLFTDNLATFAFSPFMPVACVALTFLALFWPTHEFGGSCTGFALTELLQYHGKLDLLSLQGGVDAVHDLEPDEDVQSIINFYAVQALPGHLTYHLAIDPGSEDYTAQLHDLYDTLAAGTPVYFEFYLDHEHPMKAIFKPGSGTIGVGHSIVLTGAYTDANGYPILIAADCNYADYGDGACTTLYIDKDFTELHYRTYRRGEALDGFSWTEELSQFDALKIEGTPQPLAWYRIFFRNLPSFLRQLVRLYLPI